MDTNTENHSLLESIKSLYSRLFTVMQSFRVKTYRKNTLSQDTLDIKSVLDNKIEELMPESIPEKNPQVTHYTSTVNKQDEYHYQATGTKKVVDNKLHKHITNNTISSITHPDIVKKMSDAIWEHIHTSLRAAHNGDIDKARLHTEITQQALDEISHYVSQDEYFELVSSIKQYLFEL